MFGAIRSFPDPSPGGLGICLFCSNNLYDSGTGFNIILELFEWLIGSFGLSTVRGFPVSELCLSNGGARTLSAENVGDVALVDGSVGDVSEACEFDSISSLCNASRVSSSKVCVDCGKGFG